MNNKYKYKLDTAGIIALVIGVLILVVVTRVIYYNTADSSSIGISIVSEAAVAIVGTLFGPIIAVLLGFLGTLCANAYCGIPFMYLEALYLAVFGLLIGFVAEKFGIRENRFKLKNAVLFFLMHISAVIAVFVFVKPYADYMILGRDLFAGLSLGIHMVYVCGLIVGTAITVALYIAGKMIHYVKS